MRGPDEEAVAVKFADDTALVDVSNNDDHFEAAVKDLQKWCGDHHLELNVKKTKEMVVDFRKNRTQIRELEVNGESVERVETYKYLGVHIDNRLTFADHIHHTYTKCQQRLYLLRRLSRLHVNHDILRAYYACHVESVITYAFVAWYQGCGVKDKNKLDKIVNVGSKLCGRKCNSVLCLYEKRVEKKPGKL